MDIPPLTLVKLLLPLLPLTITTVIRNYLKISPCADKADARTEATVAIIRSVMSVKRPVHRIQRFNDPGIKGQMWIAKATASAPEADVRNAIMDVARHLGDGSEKFELPDIVDVEGEWTGHRDGVDKKAPRSDLPEQQQYQSMMKECTSPVTVLYFHGGAYVLLDPITHRAVTSALAKKTGGRCFSVRYRLSPQTQFPGQLVDAFVAYLYLLSPPEGAFHEPVPARNIVFAGDSAGGNLSFSLLLCLLSLKNMGVETIRFHGKDVKIELPGGVTGNSPWLDLTRSMPSITRNHNYDYFYPPKPLGEPEDPWPEDHVWPAKPPRAEMFCQASALTHPLVSPLSARSDLWQGSPPIFVCLGQENLEDEISTVARRMYQAGVPVVFEAYEGQPHCFAMIFPTSPVGKDCMHKWSQFCIDAVKRTVPRKDTGSWMIGRSNPPKFREVDLNRVGIPDEEVHRLMHGRKENSVAVEMELLKQYENKQRAKL